MISCKLAGAAIEYTRDMSVVLRDRTVPGWRDGPATGEASTVVPCAVDSVSTISDQLALFPSVVAERLPGEVIAGVIWYCTKQTACLSEID